MNEMGEKKRAAETTTIVAPRKISGSHQTNGVKSVEQRTQEPIRNKGIHAQNTVEYYNKKKNSLLATHLNGVTLDVKVASSSTVPDDANESRPHQASSPRSLNSVPLNCHLCAGNFLCDRCLAAFFICLIAANCAHLITFTYFRIFN